MFFSGTGLIWFSLVFTATTTEQCFRPSKQTQFCHSKAPKLHECHRCGRAACPWCPTKPTPRARSHRKRRLDKVKQAHQRGDSQKFHRTFLKHLKQRFLEKSEKDNIFFFLSSAYQKKKTTGHQFNLWCWDVKQTIFISNIPTTHLFFYGFS